MENATSRISGDVSKELQLRRQIEEFYLPRQLVNAIVDAGGINNVSQETDIAIGFLDISRYTFLSRFLSPPENQAVLNGLYSAFNWVLTSHGAYLNKIEGDSLMFHFGGPIDPMVKNMDNREARKYMSRELFYTCVQLQRVTSLFNQANKNILKKVNDPSTVNAIMEAYRILGELRNGYAAAQFNALFQIRIRVGAAIGPVLIGNFGPEGVKQWDVIGMPVIDAKRMESSAPVGGLRITQEFFELLHENGITSEYHRRIRKEASAIGSVYKDISFDELFRKAGVSLKDKRNAAFETYSVQVSPTLPESIREQSELLLMRGEVGADSIVDFLKYYRGNNFVINQMESLFRKKGVVLRKDFLYQIMFPAKYKFRLENCGGEADKLYKELSEEYTLFQLLTLLGKLQDSVKDKEPESEDLDNSFTRYNDWISHVSQSYHSAYKASRDVTLKISYFQTVIFPLFFECVKGSILEYQNAVSDVEEA
ncbi:MAG: adenylate/guanylate cyclase domain-containing protein [Spirochaetales bacterium]|nr:MAG: adenylate/guanylate cyclase domain-containing protein [Spirochaetales bacterium]